MIITRPITAETRRCPVPASLYGNAITIKVIAIANRWIYPEFSKPQSNLFQLALIFDLFNLIRCPYVYKDRLKFKNAYSSAGSVP